ncbi:hypothetical protein BB558_001033 [Smittium angustum]|uniref:CTLH domain-containing protein n=1 Tax=Smittium angustum TaxID=133377 RepID=A0A2U1JCT3_SMIAN|nr:hypothetical protein BB558_001033 [Smittium angustum]
MTIPNNPFSLPKSSGDSDQKSQKDSSAIQILVYSYLIQNNYEFTAEVFAKTSGIDIHFKENLEHFPSYLRPNLSSNQSHTTNDILKNHEEGNLDTKNTKTNNKNDCSYKQSYILPHKNEVLNTEEENTSINSHFEELQDGDLSFESSQNNNDTDMDSVVDLAYNIAMKSLNAATGGYTETGVNISETENDESEIANMDVDMDENCEELYNFTPKITPKKPDLDDSISHSGARYSTNWETISNSHLHFLRIRKYIFDRISIGDIDSAITLLNLHFPAVLRTDDFRFVFKTSEQRTEIDPSLLSIAEIMLKLPPVAFSRNLNVMILRYRLDSQRFLELVRNNQIAEALEFNQNTLCHYKGLLKMWLDNALICESVGSTRMTSFTIPQKIFHQNIKDTCRNNNTESVAKKNESTNETNTYYSDILGAQNSLNSSSHSVKPNHVLKPLTIPNRAITPIGVEYSNMFYSKFSVNDTTPFYKTIKEVNENMISHNELKLAYREMCNHHTKICSLLIYPSRDFLSETSFFENGYRRNLAEAINQAILESLGFPQEPALITDIRQTLLVTRLLSAGQKDMNTELNLYKNIDQSLEIAAGLNSV